MALRKEIENLWIKPKGRFTVGSNGFWLIKGWKFIDFKVSKGLAKKNLT